MVQTHVCILQTTLDMIDQVDKAKHQICLGQICSSFAPHNSQRLL